MPPNRLINVFTFATKGLKKTTPVPLPRSLRSFLHYTPPPSHTSTYTFFGVISSSCMQPLQYTTLGPPGQLWATEKDLESLQAPRVSIRQWLPGGKQDSSEAVRTPGIPVQSCSNVSWEEFLLEISSLLGLPSHFLPNFPYLLITCPRILLSWSASGEWI